MSSERHEWKSFRLQEFGEPYMVWHDGPDFEPLIAHCATDPDEVVRMLRLGLVQQDPLAADAIDVLGARGALDQDFTEDLLVAIEEASGEFRISTARTLILRTGIQKWSADIIDVLLHDRSSFVRLDAARALAVVEPTPTVVDALVKAVADRRYLVRYHAANSLLSQSHAGMTVEEDEWLFSRIGKDTRRRQWLEAATALRRRFSDS